MVHAPGTDAWRRDYDRVAAAIVWLRVHRHAQPSIEELAVALHLSPRHLHRTFARFAGVSPHRLLRWLTYDAAREHLRSRATVLDTVAATGMSSPGRLHDLAVTMEAVTPGELSSGGAGLVVRTGVHPTRFGSALVATTDRGVLALRFVDSGAADPAGELQAAWPRAEHIDDPDTTRPVADHLDTVLAAGAATVATPLPVLVAGTNLQVQVWRALLAVPDHQVTTYGALAAAAGRPDATRAVASAVGRNPVAALIPCHRVLRASGELGGYRWGTVRKQAMLAREAARA